MKRRDISIINRLFIFFALLLTACSLEKKSGFNRRMQNLTAHYNVLFNAREIIKEKQDAYATGFIDNYSELLSVYQDTAAIAGEDKDLEAATSKAQYIISFKEQSKYLGDAYLVLGKTNYLEKQYFNALEYFNYVLRSYTEKPKLTQEARVWKARTLMQLNQYPEADSTLNLAIQSINPKDDITADIYATRLQYDINQQEYVAAEEMAKQAIKYANNSKQRLRWTFILGQLQEMNGKPTEAMASYTRIVRSNAVFEMAFNADLNRIRIEDMRDGVKISRVDRLKSLLRNQNNEEFTDQIYYQIAQIYYAEGNIDKALENYKLSTQFSTKNLNQKGLSYLRQADIYFKNKADYVSAKNYYDSTLLNLSAAYPGYNAIKKKTDNLQLLTENLAIIAREDTLQMLAGLDETARTARIDELVKRNAVQRQQQQTANETVNAVAPLDINNVSNPQPNTPTGSSFYFYSNAAVSSGFASFKRKWGNRRLEDNWRRSQRTNTNLTVNNSQVITPDVQQGKLQPQSNVFTGTDEYRQQLLRDVPVTPELMAASNTRIYNAYFDIANFYRDVIEDKKEAIANYELILKRFPNNPNKAAIYYSLFRLYSEFDMAKANFYKDLLLKDYADTPYAKVIIDPDYGKRLNDADAEFNALYNQVYDLYAQRKYLEVMQQVDVLMQQYPQNKLAPQLLYLRALAKGRQVKIDPLKTDLISIASTYQNDQLVTPLVNQHLQYIDNNYPEMALRRFAILDSDPDYIPFRVDSVGPMVSNFATVADKKVEKPKKEEAKPQPKTEDKKPEAPVITKAETAVTDSAAINAPAEKPKKVYQFNESDNANYYFVVNVASLTTNLASSRFGIGQFNRTRYQGVNIRHQLKPAGQNQLIYVGRFNNVEDAKAYARAIIPLMPEIMKVPKDKYSFFIITQQNLDKLADKKMLDSYIEYYQDTF
ncbi:hypothetical protein EOD41_06350 [Mucilaginibacter limnophilus]|uniref:Tetratricopeptide repeat protein n=1 Tax=Mucilaginibacter limnophilus TaxID=1932778 RepID=A0A437MVB6_9SPHI|nr:tetratricopeptide repeat protein [Mucilaginibacter limnophilus]RVU01583.1 hypothetical protein EOD41_06350 [Mucilaginibacter limnophilus]